MDSDLIDWRQRRYVSQYATETVGLALHVAGSPGDADGAVSATLVRQLADGTTSDVGTYTATHVSTGLYEVTLPSAATAEPGDYALEWAYEISSAAHTYVVYLVVGQANPHYDALPGDAKDLLETVWFRFADLFDSASGGPHLASYFQSHWSRGRMAQLMAVGLGQLNTIAQPYSLFTIDGNGGAMFPYASWGPLLATSTYVEAIKHLIRSYVEQPQLITGASITRQERRDYMDRWKMVLDMETDALKSQLETWKITQMRLGRPRVLVSGGVFGRYAPTRIAGSVAARPRYYARFY